ncbi:MAG: C4-type zinc ribbon domain-containing protein [Actinomycetota bacterium]|nr:C4-type zinc ribbon domain-containing protein [Actinomycetota bacterium]
MDEHKILLELQKIDSQIDALDYQEKNLPERERYFSLRDEVGKIEALYKTISAKLRSEAAVQKRIEDEISSLSVKIDKDQARLYSGTIASPKELSNLQQEISILKEQLDSKETDLLEQIDVVENLRTNERAVEDRLKAKKDEMLNAKEEMDRLLGDIHEKKQVLQAKREPVYASLEPEVRQLYDRVRSKYQLAVTVLEEGICQGCRVELPSVEAQRMVASSKLERCPTCTRILVKV